MPDRGGMLMTRHGGASHYMRPDRVYRTSVLSPIAGYSPGVDVQAVAMGFTRPFGPNGLAGFDGSGGRLSAWWANLKARIATWKAGGMPMPTTQPAMMPAPIQPGPAMAMGAQIAPQIGAQMSMLRALAPSHGSPFSERRWNSYYYAG